MSTPEAQAAPVMTVTRAGRLLAEAGVLAYLVAMPAGPALPAPARDAILAAGAVGLLMSRVPARSAGSIHDPPPAPFGLLVPLGISAAALALSVGVSPSPAESLARAAYAPVAWLLFLGAQEAASTARGYARLLMALAAAVAVAGADGLYQYGTGRSFLGDIPLYQGRVSASLPHPNDLAMLPLLLPLILGGGGRVALPGSPAEEGARRRAPAGGRRRLALVARTGATLLGIVTVVLSGSRTAWLGLLVSLVGLAVLGQARRAAAAALGLGLALFAAAWALGLPPVAERARAGLDPTQDPRMGLWGVALEMFRASPLVGQGFHTFGQHHAGFLAAGPAPSPAAGAPRDLVEIPWPHSLYLEALAEGGLAGLAGLLAPCLGIAFVLRRSWRHGTEAERRVAAALVAALLAFLAEGAVELTWHKDWVLLVFWLLAALAARLPVLGPPAASGAVAGGGAGPARPG